MNIPSISRIGSLLMFAMAGRRSPVSQQAVQRILSGVALIIGLSVIAAFFVASLIGIGLYAIYAGLVANGLASHVALLVTCLAVAALICIIVLVIQENMRKLRSLPDKLMQTQTPPVVGAVQGVTGAFMDGLMGEPKGHRA